jgi:hypothetical protein
MTPKKDPPLNLTLLENGIDFILKGIDELFDDTDFRDDLKIPTQFSQRNLKYGCLHIFSGFLLVLKHRLAQHGPELIYQGRLGDVKAKLASNKFPNTLDFDGLLERLEIGPRIVFEEIDLDVLRRMQDLRNRFEHSEVTMNKYQVWSALTNFLDLVDVFLANELGIELEKNSNSNELLNKIKKIDAAWERIENQMKAERFAELEQKLSDFRVRKSEILTEIAPSEFDPIDGGEVLLICEECEEETLIGSGGYAGICMNCENLMLVAYCARCGEPAKGVAWNPDFCDGCEDYIAAQ